MLVPELKQVAEHSLSCWQCGTSYATPPWTMETATQDHQQRAHEAGLDAAVSNQFEIEHSLGNHVEKPITPNPLVDSVVLAVCADLLKRSEFGIKKYGVTLDRTDFSLKQWLQYAYEECLDEANYLKRAILTMEGKP